jgi:hypothetical protein
MENAIARLELRELAERELLESLSEARALTRAFRVESGYENAIEHTEKENDNSIRTQ